MVFERISVYFDPASLSISSPPHPSPGWESLLSIHQNVLWFIVYVPVSLTNVSPGGQEACLSSRCPASSTVLGIVSPLASCVILVKSACLLWFSVVFNVGENTTYQIRLLWIPNKIMDVLHVVKWVVVMIMPSRVRRGCHVMYLCSSISSSFSSHWISVWPFFLNILTWFIPNRRSHSDLHSSSSLFRERGTIEALMWGKSFSGYQPLRILQQAR